MLGISGYLLLFLYRVGTDDNFEEVFFVEDLLGYGLKLSGSDGLDGME